MLQRQSDSVGKKAPMIMWQDDSENVTAIELHGVSVNAVAKE